MIQVFLSYSRTDGLDAADRLRDELTAMGFGAWRDVEEMQGGLNWKRQLHQALVAVDAVLVLLTPGAVASPTVTWEWETALIADKRVIPILLSPCAVPVELNRLHYHRLDDPTTYTLGLAKLTRDLLHISFAQSMTQVTASGAARYSIGVAIDSAIGDNPIVVNQAGGATTDAAAATRILLALHAWQRETSGSATDEFRTVLSDIRTQLGTVTAGIDDLLAGQMALLTRFDQEEQRVLAVLLARFDAQQVALSNAILDALEGGVLTADEIDRHLSVMEAALVEVNQRAARIEDRQLVDVARQVSDFLEAPQLDAKHKLKVTIPIIPVFLAYEGEIELNSRLDLEKAWETLKRRQTADRATVGRSSPCRLSTNGVMSPSGE
jgi:hypothetical protein